MSLLDLASLVLAPTATKEGKVYSAIPDTGDGDMTFTRGSAATRVNSAGLIEKERANLLVQSNTFDTTWSSVLTANVVGGQSGYDGSSDAWTLETQSGQASRRAQNLSGLESVNSFSVYAKANTLDWMRLQISTASGNYVGDFDLTNGVSGYNFGDPLPSIESVGNGWYRVKISGFNVPTQVRIYALSGNNDFSGAGTIFIQDAMLNQGLVAQSYIETTTTAVYEGITDDVPRVDYSGGGCPSLLLEPSRTNLIDDYSGYTWDEFNGASIAFNGNQQSPEGLDNAVTWTFSGTSGEVVQRSSITISNSTTYTISGYFKLTSGTLTSGSNQFKGLDGLAGANVSLNTLTSEWQRLSFNVTSSSTTGRVQFRCDDSATIQVYGLQLEAGSYSTSLIPTYGTSTTRAVDIVDGAVDASLFNDSEGVLFVEFAALADTRDNDFRFLICDGTNNERIQIFLPTSNILNVDCIVSNSATANLTYTLTNPSSSHKVAFKYKNNDFALWVDGVERGTDTSGGTPTGLDRLDFYRTPNNNNYVEANVKQAIYFGTALTDTQLQELTK